MIVYILTPYTASAPWGPLVSVPNFEDETERNVVTAGKPETDLYLIRADLTTEQIAAVKADGRFFVLEDGKGSECQTFLAGKAPGHGVQSGDSVAQQVARLAPYCRNLPLYDSIDAEDFYSAADNDYGGAWDTTDTASVSRTGGGELVLSEQINAIQSQWSAINLPLTTAQGHVLWGGDHIHASNLISGGAETGRFVQGSAVTAGLHTGFLMASVFSFTGTCNLANVDAAWLKNHSEPFLNFVNGSGQIWFEAMGIQANTGRASPGEYNDGNPHVFIINYDPVASVAEYWADDDKLFEVPITNDAGGWNAPAMVCGNRAGISQKAYKLLARNRCAADDAEIARLTAWGLQGLS